jgi:hypothetical protein
LIVVYLFIRYVGCHVIISGLLVVGYWLFIFRRWLLVGCCFAFAWLLLLGCFFLALLLGFLLR